MNKLTSLFRKPTADEMAQQELAQARRDLLAAQSGSDYARRMVEYHGDRVKRLSQFLSTAAATRA